MDKTGGVINGLRRRLAELLQAEPERRGRRPMQRACPSQADGVETPGPADARQMLEHVRSALGDRAELAIGRVNFFNLDQIKERLGASWPRVADRVDDLVRRAIESRFVDRRGIRTPLSG